MTLDQSLNQSIRQSSGFLSGLSGKDHCWVQRPFSMCFNKFYIWGKVTNFSEFYRRRSSVNFGGRHFAPNYVYEKLTKCPNFTSVCRKIFSRFFFWGGGRWPPLLPVSYAYDKFYQVWFMTAVMKCCWSSAAVMVIRRWDIRHCDSSAGTWLRT